MERIVIIGCSASGKSTLAKELEGILSLPVYHLDKLWLREGWEGVGQEEFDARLEEIMATGKWILDGNYARTMERRIAKCDTVIYLDMSRWTCLRGLAKRVVTNYGRVREDMAEGCPERFDPDSIRWVWDYNRENRAQNYELLSRATHAQVIVLKSRREVRRFLRSLSDGETAQ